MSDIVLTPQQESIVQAMTSRTFNVVVNAVAGASKTFTSLHACQLLPPNASVMILTYNSRLKSETRTKVSTMNMSERVQVNTYHSACVRHYDPVNGKEDIGISKVVDNPDCIPYTPICFDVLIIDECQDMTELYFRFVCKMIRDNARPNISVAVFGDLRQCIYRFKDAEPRLFRLMPKLLSNSTWKKFSLSTSFRITRAMCEFVNRHLKCSSGERFGDVEMRAHRQGMGTPVRYIVASNMYQTPLDELMSELRSGNTHAGDVFVLAPSLHTGTSRMYINALENRLVAMKIPCFVPTSRNMSVGDPSLLKGKVVFSTFHQSKGLERPVVIIMGFDASSCSLFFRDEEDTDCPNELYVACTRATRKLVLIRDATQPPLPFMKDVCTTEYMDVVRDDEEETCCTVYKHRPSTKNKECDLSSVMRFKSCSCLMKVSETLKLVVSVFGGNDRRHQYQLPKKAGKEFVADLHMDIVMASLMLHQSAERIKSMVNPPDYDSNTTKSKIPPYLTKCISERINALGHKVHDTTIDLPIEDLAYICVLADAKRHGYIHRLTQLKQWGWVGRNNIIPKMKSLVVDTCIKHPRNNVALMHSSTCKDTLVTVCPHVVNPETREVWHLTTTEPTLDTAISATLQCYITEPSYTPCILCVSSGTVQRIAYDVESAKRAIEILKDTSVSSAHEESDEDFVKRVLDKEQQSSPLK